MNLNKTIVILKKVNKHFEEHSFLTFSTIAIILTCVYVVYILRNGQKESQDKIINCQVAQINQVKSILNAVNANTEKAFLVNQDKLNKLINDSLLRNVNNLDSLQKLEVAKYVKQIISISASQLAYKSWLKEINSSLGQKELTQIQMENKSLLELEFNKIQNEYQTLAVWSGVLMIVFLIFSFYSFFKTDDLVKQGRDGLREIGEIKKEGIEIINKTQDSHNILQKEIINSKDKIQKIDKNLTNFGNKAENLLALIENLEKQKDILEQDLLIITEDLEKQKDISEREFIKMDSIPNQEEPIESSTIDSFTQEEEEEDHSPNRL